MSKIKLIIFLLLLAVLIFLLYFINSASKTQAQVDSVNNVSGIAVIHNTGDTIYFSGTNGGTTGNMNYGVNYSNNAFSGYAWSPEYGWVLFNGNSATVPSFQNDNESPTNWANGQISLSGSNGGSTGNMTYSVVFNPTTGIADPVNHWAWGGNVLGWINFSAVVVSGENDLCPTVSGIQTVYPCGPCPNYPDATSIPSGMIIDSVSGNCVTPSPTTDDPNLNSNTSGFGLTTIVWNNAIGCVPIANILFPTWSALTLNDYGSLELTVPTTTVFSMNCNGTVISTTVCVIGTPTPAGVICKKPPHYIED